MGKKNKMGFGQLHRNQQPHKKCGACTLAKFA